jgi:acyl-coenzyme A synthetase/AMP-(fatty) acid ligase
LLVLSEVESIAMDWPGVAAAVAVPWSRDASIGRGFSIVIEPEDVAMPPDIAALRHEAVRTLPPFARPDHFHVISRLPRLANGKPDRRTLQKECGYG